LPLSVVKPNFLPKLSTSLSGSTPGERIKKIGVAFVVSSYERETKIKRNFIFY
jgi:hypothetical protein